jgi:hypothetical protein
MKIVNADQGSMEWLEARMGVPTASELDALVSPLWKVRESAGVDSYVAFKLAEKFRGYPIQTFQSGMMEQGEIREKEALPSYEFNYDCKIKRVGFILTDDGMAGCSPDGMFSDGTGIEVKCPEPQKHVLYLLGGECPKEYRHQVQGSMYVTGAATWKFFSYCRGFPDFVITVARDEKTMESIAEAIGLFHEKFDAGWVKLVAANGGRVPERPKPVEQAEPTPLPEVQGTMTQDEFNRFMEEGNIPNDPKARTIRQAAEEGAR